MWIATGGFTLFILALVAVTGLVPGDTTRATVDHCYVRWHDWEPRETKCTGHWTRLGRAYTGRVFGVDVPTKWRSLVTRADGWNEVTVPDIARNQPTLAVPGAALVAPWRVGTVRVALVIAVAIWLLLLGALAAARQRGPGAARPGTAQP